MTAKTLSKQILEARSGETEDILEAPRISDQKAAAVTRFVEQTRGTHMVIDPKENRLVAFVNNGARLMNKAQKSLTRNLDALGQTLEQELGHALMYLDETLSPEAGGKPMVLKAQQDASGARMTDVASSAGLNSGVARMFFQNAEERGAAHAMGIQTVIMWQAPKTNHIHVASSPEPLNTAEPRFSSAFPDRSELSMMNSRQGPVAAVAEFSGGRQMSFQVSTEVGQNPLEDFMKDQLRKNKRELADDEEDLRYMRPGA